jgi:hypothetical protein
MIHRWSVTPGAGSGRVAAARPVLLLIALLLVSPAGGLAQGDPATVVHVRNEATPPGVLQTLRLDELWRTGGKDEDVVLGVITGALTDADGNLYLLDRQLKQVHVFSAAGKYLRSLSREGEGPGEVGDASGMLWMPDGTLGILQAFPGRIVKVDREGTPKGELVGGGQDPAAGGFHSVNSALFRAGNFVVSGESMMSTDAGFSRRRFLALWNADGSEKCRLIERPGSVFDGLGPPKFIEKEEYFADAGRWDIGADGRIYAAPDFALYSVRVFGADGKLAFVIDREFTSWKRTAAEKERAGSRMRVETDGHELKIENHVENLDPCIRTLRVTSGGELWVLSSRGVREQPAGILQTWDVFDHEGRFVRQVAVACEGDPLQDSLVFADDGHAVLLRGSGTATKKTPDEASEPPAMKVVYYRVAG